MASGGNGCAGGSGGQVAVAAMTRDCSGGNDCEMARGGPRRTFFFAERNRGGHYSVAKIPTDAQPKQGGGTILIARVLY